MTRTSCSHEFKPRLGGRLASVAPSAKLALFTGALVVAAVMTNVVALNLAYDVPVKVRKVDPSKFRLVSRGFHWVHEYPFNR